MSFPTDNQSSVSLTVSDTEVQDAFKLINGVLASDGFVREQSPSNASVQGFVASYSKLDSEGGRRLGEMVGVYLKANLVEIVFLEGRHTSADVRMSANRVLDLLEGKLSSRYGSDRIKVVKVKS
jgi:hypothetical protein